MTFRHSGPSAAEISKEDLVYFLLEFSSTLAAQRSLSQAVKFGLYTLELLALFKKGVRATGGG